MFKNKKINYLHGWTVALGLIIYLTSVHFHCCLGYLILFIAVIMAGIAFDFMICEWTHFLDNPVKPVSGRKQLVNFLNRIPYHYEHFDVKWKNLKWYLLLLLHGLIVFALIGITSELGYIKEKVNWWNMIALTGMVLPYFFHRAYYYCIRIPEFKHGVYVYYQRNEETVIEDCKEIELVLNMEGQAPGWLQDKKAIFVDKEKNIRRYHLPIPYIKETWTYNQILDIIFYWNNQTDLERVYKSDWPPIDLYTGNDELVRTCWSVKIETGAASEDIPVKTNPVSNFNLSEFSEKRVKVNGLLILERVI